MLELKSRLDTDGETFSEPEDSSKDITQSSTQRKYGTTYGMD